jgi:hypothetical protein
LVTAIRASEGLTISVVKLIDLEAIFAAQVTIVVEFIPECKGGEPRSWEFGYRTEIKTINSRSNAV